MFIFRLNEVKLKVDKAGTRCKKQDIRTMAGGGGGGASCPSLSQ